MSDYEITTIYFPNEETKLIESCVFYSKPKSKKDPFPDWKRERKFLARKTPDLKHIVLMMIDIEKQRKHSQPVPDIIGIYHRLSPAQIRLDKEAEKYASQLKEELGLDK